jgi:hypothetical protein
MLLEHSASLATGSSFIDDDVFQFNPGPDQSQPGFILNEAIVSSQGNFWIIYLLDHTKQDAWAEMAQRARQLAEELPAVQRQRVLAYIDSVIEEAAALAVVAHRTARDPEGGVVFYFWGTETMAGGAHRKYASLECSAEDGMFVTMDDRLSDSPKVWEVTGQEEGVRTALEQIRDFIGK